MGLAVEPPLPCPKRVVDGNGLEGACKQACDEGCSRDCGEQRPGACHFRDQKGACEGCPDRAGEEGAHAQYYQMGCEVAGAAEGREQGREQGAGESAGKEHGHEYAA